MSPGRGPGPCKLAVGGITPLTTIDYPGELALVVFCQGCPWRCRYCQNPHLIPRRGDAKIAWDEVLGLLSRRRGLLDAVVFSGGEPTLQRGLEQAAVAVRALGFRVGIHTAGCYPEHLGRLLPLVDWVGLDIKALPEDYPALTTVAGSGGRAFASLDCLVRSGIDHEVRVTVHDALLPPRKLARLLRLLDESGARAVVLQRCRTQSVLDPSLGDNTRPWPYPARCLADTWSDGGRATYP